MYDSRLNGKDAFKQNKSAGETGSTKTDGDDSTCLLCYSGAYFECRFQNVKLAYKTRRSGYIRANETNINISLQKS